MHIICAIAFFLVGGLIVYVVMRIRNSDTLHQLNQAEEQISLQETLLEDRYNRRATDRVNEEKYEGPNRRRYGNGDL